MRESDRRRAFGPWIHNIVSRRSSTTPAHASASAAIRWHARIVIFTAVRSATIRLRLFAPAVRAQLANGGRRVSNPQPPSNAGALPVERRPPKSTTVSNSDRFGGLRAPPTRRSLFMRNNRICRCADVRQDLVTSPFGRADAAAMRRGDRHRRHGAQQPRPTPSGREFRATVRKAWR